MPPTHIRTVLVDTNCFLRLYQSPVFPLLGQEINGFRLLTLGCLIDEFLTNESLVERYCWVASEPKRGDLLNAALRLRGANQRSVDQQVKLLRPYSKAVLTTYCRSQGIDVKSLSSRDIELLATTVVLKGVMATDDWPLRYVAEQLMEDKAAYPIDLMSSVGFLRFLEENGQLSSEDRRNTVDAWLRNQEPLLRGWRDEYREGFGESPDQLGL